MGDFTDKDTWKWMLDMRNTVDDSWWTGTDEKTEEEVLREKYPSLQDAWEKYQSILRLVKIEDERAK